MTVKVVHKSEEIPDKPIDGKPTLVYWNIVGLVLPIRLALVHAGVDFEEVRIEAGDPKAPDLLEAWRTAKHGRLSKVMHFPNLPYFLDGDGVALTQTNTILRHVARKWKMVSAQEHMTDLACDQLTDFESQMIGLVYGKGPSFVLNWYKTDVPGVLVKFSDMLSGTPFLTGDEPGIDDFKFYSFLHKMRLIQEDLGSPETKGIITDDLVAFMTRIEDLPNVKEYMAGPDHQSKPLNNTMAKWIGN
jgi:glutathione S-transferase